MYAKILVSSWTLGSSSFTHSLTQSLTHLIIQKLCIYQVNRKYVEYKMNNYINVTIIQPHTHLIKVFDTFNGGYNGAHLIQLAVNNHTTSISEYTIYFRTFLGCYCTQCTYNTNANNTKCQD